MLPIGGSQQSRRASALPPPLRAVFFRVEAVPAPRALREWGLWQFSRSKRCEDWGCGNRGVWRRCRNRGCGNFRLRRVAQIGVMAVETERQQGVLLGTLRFWGLWQADPCHNPHPRNAARELIATTPKSTTGSEIGSGVRKRGAWGKCAGEKNVGAVARKKKGRPEGRPVKSACVAATR